MKYFIKHKLILFFGVMVVLGNFMLSAAPVSALTQSNCPVGTKLNASGDSLCCPTGTKLNASDDTICCPSGQKPAQVHGQGVQRSCCPAAAVDKAVADGKSDATLTQGYTAKYCLFSKYINPLINLLSAAVGVVVVMGIIFGAIQFSASAGDPQKAANGKNHIRNALLGLLAYILFYAFLQFIIPGGKLS